LVHCRGLLADEPAGSCTLLSPRTPRGAQPDRASLAPPSSSHPCRAMASWALLVAVLRWRRHQERLAHRVLQYVRRPTPMASVPQTGQTTGLGLRRAASCRASSLGSRLMLEDSTF
jgi:hypothetical protein